MDGDFGRDSHSCPGMWTITYVVRNDRLLTCLRLLQQLSHARSQLGLARAFFAVEFTRAACDSLRNSTRAEPRKRRCAPPINAHLPPPTYNPSTYVIPHLAHFLIISRHTLSITATPNRSYLDDTTSLFFQGIGFISI